MGSTVSLLIFYAVLFNIWLFPTVMILFDNPIYAILSFILVVLNVFVMLLLLNVEFMAIIYLIVYIGAIVVLFLFLLIMIDLKRPSFYNMSFQDNLFARIFYLKTFSLLATSVYYNFYFQTASSLAVKNKTQVHEQTWNALSSKLSYFSNDITIFSQFLYTQNIYLFLLSSFILLVSMVGSIILVNNFYE